MHPADEPTRQLSVTGWIGAPPELRAETDVVNSLTDELIELVRPYGIDAVPYLATRIEVQLSPTDATGWSEAVTAVTAFVRRWAARLRAAAAFVSVAGRNDLWQIVGDDPGVTRFEYGPDRGVVQDWPAVCRYARGAFWGMALGRERCQTLGGLDFVLQNAPAAHVGPFGEGVWLQLSDEPPASPEHLQHLTEFLQPVLNWSWADLKAIRMRQAAVDQVKAWQQIGPPEPDAATRRLAKRQLRNTARSEPRNSVPVSGLSELEIDSALNVELAAPPSALQQAIVEAILDEWYRKGFEGGFGGGEFHMLRGPSLDGAVLTWAIDFGSGDTPAAVRELAEKLAAAPDVTVRALRIGVQ